MAQVASYRAVCSVRYVFVLTFGGACFACFGYALAPLCSDPLEVHSIVLGLPLLILGSWFAYLARRGWRVGLEVTDTEVRIRRVANDYVIPLKSIASIEIEDLEGESDIFRYHTARDSSGEFLFRIPPGETEDEFLDVVRSACGLVSVIQKSEPRASADGGA